MSKAFLITGFNNWGKTTVINTLFNSKKYYSGKTYSINGINKQFIVEGHSNDDIVGPVRYINALKNKYGNKSPQLIDLFGALCPTRESINDSAVILNDSFFQQNFTDIYLIYLEYKWDYHAKLLFNQIMGHYEESYNGTVKLHHIIINADQGLPGKLNDDKRTTLKVDQIIDELKKIP